MLAFFSPTFSWEGLDTEHTQVVCRRVKDCLLGYTSRLTNARGYRKRLLAKITQLDLPWLYDSNLDVFPESLDRPTATALQRAVILTGTNLLAIFPDGYFVENAVSRECTEEGVRICHQALQAGVAFKEGSPAFIDLESHVLFQFLRQVLPPTQARLETHDGRLLLSVTHSGNLYHMSLSVKGLQVTYKDQVVGVLDLSADLFSDFINLIHPTLY